MERSTKMLRFEMKAPQEWLAAVDAWREKQPGISPTRAEAVRRLVEIALKK
jgi:hypothetical protein